MDFDVIVIGQGIAGLTCTNEMANQGLKVANFEREFPGGLVMNVNALEHFEEAGGMSGMDHAMVLARDNMRAGVSNQQSAVTSIHCIDGGFEVSSDEGTHSSRAVVVASGARLRKLDVAGESEYEGRGVSHCADCDAPMFAGVEVVVVGGGDWAIQDALLLAEECSAVHVVFNASELSACPEYRDRARAEPKVRLHPNTRVDEILGDQTGMTGVRLLADGAVTELACAGLFALVGLQPNSEGIPDAVARDANGYVIVDAECETAVPRMWAVGQVRAGFPGWLTDAAADARRVAKAVSNRLK